MKKNTKNAAIFFASVLVLTAVVKDRHLDNAETILDNIAPSKTGDEAFFLDQPFDLTYRFYYASIFPLGTLRFSGATTENRAKIISLEATPAGGLLERAIQAFIKLESHFAPDGPLPDLYVEKTRYKQKTKTKTITFDRKNLIATRGDRKIAIPPETQDPAGAFLAALSAPLTASAPVTVKCLAEDVIYDMKITLIEETPRVIKALLEIKNARGASAHAASLYVWLEKTTRRPLLFKSWTPIGYATVVLKQTQ